MRRFYLPQTLTPGETRELDAEESVHAARVLRLRSGETVAVFDGHGVEFEAELVEVSARRTTVRLLRESQPAPEASVEITLAFALAKRNATDLIIQKAVELGVARLRPFVSQRCVARDDKPKPDRLDRWKRTIRDATKQCGRAKLCEIESPVEWGELVAGESDETRVVCWEESRDGAALSGVLREAKTEGVTIAIGPEGGLTSEEIDQARERNWQVASLGPRVLRAETAAIAAVTAALVGAGEV